MTVAIEREDLMEAARAVLDGNRAGNSTKPSPDSHPHQWMWDSCFIAIGISRYDPERAQNELRSLLRGQWSNGMVPQIVFNPDSTGYFPGPETWQSSRSPFAPADIQTSGITQPPILATAALAAYGNDPNLERAKAFADEVYPKIVAYHDFLYRERDPRGTGLITVLHPWESGLDNSPPYLDAGSRVHLTYKPHYTRLDTTHVSASNRPSNKDYDLFVWLLEQMRTVDYNWSRYLSSAQMQVQDVLFNTILCVAGIDLAVLGKAAGAAEDDLVRLRKRSAWTAAAVDDKLWDKESRTYFSRDELTGRLLEEGTVVSLIPVYAGRAGIAHGQEILTALIDSPRFWPSGGYAIPTTALDSKWFNPENYWLGPVWVNTNWLLIKGMEHWGQYQALADRLRADTIALIQKSGFREYFNPLTGEGYGTNQFSWSAALTIDLLSS